MNERQAMCEVLKDAYRAEVRPIYGDKQLINDIVKKLKTMVEFSKLTDKQLKHIAKNKLKDMNAKKMGNHIIDLI